MRSVFENRRTRRRGGRLPRALANLGHEVSVYLPRYRQTKLSDPETVVASITVPFDDKYRFASVVTAGSSADVKFYFVDYPPYFDREALYGTSAADYPTMPSALRSFRAPYSKPRRFSACRKFFIVMIGSRHLYR